MKIAKLAGGSLLALVLALACGGMSTQSGGSNTNWFATCSSPADCGAGLTCWCGLCTKTCGTGCDSGPSSATCSAPPDGCTEPPSMTACAVGCTKDADCKGLGASAVCLDSVCRKSTGGKLQCDAVSSEAYSRIQTIIDGADDSCQSADDCVVEDGAFCSSSCGFGIVSKSAAALVSAELPSIEQALCKPFEDAGCTALAGRCMAPLSPACVAGKCQGRIPGEPADGGVFQCDAVSNDASSRIRAIIDGADDSCQSDADCVVEDGASCSSSCGFGIVSKSAAALVSAELPSIEQQLCKPFTDAGCHVIALPCVSPGAPGCVGGKCQARFPGQSMDGGSAALPACSWPSSFDAPDATAGQCRAARMYLSCRGSNGGGELCLSDDPTQCPGPNPTPGVTYSDCTDQCQPGEYALACGGPGPGPWPEPPAACRSLPAGPGGGSVSCCPCGS